MACSEFCLRTMLPTEGSSQLLKMGHGGQAAAAWMASFGYNQGAVSLVAESSPFRHRPFDPCSATSSELARRFRSEAIFSPRVSTATEGSLSEDPVDIERKAPEPWRVADVTSDKEAAGRAMQCVDAMPHLTSYLSTLLTHTSCLSCASGTWHSRTAVAAPSARRRARRRTACCWARARATSS